MRRTQRPRRGPSALLWLLGFGVLTSAALTLFQFNARHGGGTTSRERGRNMAGDMARSLGYDHDGLDGGRDEPEVRSFVTDDVRSLPAALFGLDEPAPAPVPKLASSRE